MGTIHTGGLGLTVVGRGPKGVSGTGLASLRGPWPKAVLTSVPSHPRQGRPCSNSGRGCRGTSAGPGLLCTDTCPGYSSGLGDVRGLAQGHITRKPPGQAPA